MIINEDGRNRCICEICGHEWYQRGRKEPWKCPMLTCQSTRWNKEGDDGMLTQLDQLSLLKELERRNKNEYGNQGDEYGMGDIDDKVELRVKKALHEEALQKNINSMREELDLLKKANESLDECPECHNRVPSNARRCPYCPAEFEQDGE